MFGEKWKVQWLDDDKEWIDLTDCYEEKENAQYAKVLFVHRHQYKPERLRLYWQRGFDAN